MYEDVHEIMINVVVAKSIIVLISRTLSRLPRNGFLLACTIPH